MHGAFYLDLGWAIIKFGKKRASARAGQRSRRERRRPDERSEEGAEKPPRGLANIPFMRPQIFWRAPTGRKATCRLFTSEAPEKGEQEPPKNDPSKARAPEGARERGSEPLSRGGARRERSERRDAGGEPRAGACIKALFYLFSTSQASYASADSFASELCERSDL